MNWILTIVIILMILYIIDLQITITKMREDITQLFRQDKILIDHIIYLNEKK